MAERFYLNCPLAPGRVLVQGAEAHHLAHVCRLRPGDPVVLFNGDGHEYSATIIAVRPREVETLILEERSPQRELSFRLLIAAPVPKGDRAQFLIEKLTELGATAYTPLRTARSVVHPGEAKRERFERYVIEASKQCGRNTLMTIEPLTDWATLLQRPDLPAERFLAHQGAERKAIEGVHDLICAVGPEGGFTEEEVEQARNNGWRLASLGSRVLRIETAALALAALASQP